MSAPTHSAASYAAPTHSAASYAAPTLSALPGAALTQAGTPTGCLPPGPLTAAELAAAVREGADRERYHRIWHGMYRREDQPDDLRLRGLTLTRTFPEGVLRGRSAALLWGDDAVPADVLPEIWLPSTRRSRPGRVYRYGAMPREAVTEVDGVRVTTLLRTCRDLAADLPFGDAVVAVERMCAANPELAAQLSAAAAHPSGRGMQRFVDVVDAIDPRTTSADESRARQVLVVAGYDGFGCGHSVRANRRMVALPLADPTVRCMVIEGPAWAEWGESTRAALRNAGWAVVVIKGPAAPEAELATGAEPATRTDVADVLRSRWPATSLLEPLDRRLAADPHGMWAS